MALPPVIPGHDAPIAYWAGDTIVVPAHAQYPQAAKEFVAYAGETSVEESILPKYSLIPGVGNYNPAALKPLGPVDLSVLQAAKTIGSVPSWDLIVPPALGQAWENQRDPVDVVGPDYPAGLGAEVPSPVAETPENSGEPGAFLGGADTARSFRAQTVACASDGSPLGTSAPC